jgi:hypothetical protein
MYNIVCLLIQRVTLLDYTNIYLTITDDQLYILIQSHDGENEDCKEL